jgi:hypothetical protein
MPVRQVPTVAQDFRLWLRNAALTINDITKGRSNNSGVFTLTANVATSTLTDDRVGFDSCIALVPTTANAAAEIGNGTLYIAETGRINGSVVINHANNAQTDRTFRFIISG